jgi:cellulose synthase/poly-beta-1,6-N-acetylglucosamine synthase-like glycosyltransferase
MILIGLAGLLLVCATAPAAMFVVNLRRYRAPDAEVQGAPRVSVLIPARDEAGNIRACVESVLASLGVALEVLVLDDASTDSTAAIVREARSESRG